MDNQIYNNDGWFNQTTDGNPITFWDIYWGLITYPFKYLVRQGESLDMEVEVKDLNNVAVQIGTPTAMICNLFVKGKQWAGFESGLTSGTTTFNNGELIYQTITSYSGNILKIHLDSAHSKKIPVGAMIASIKIKTGTEIKEYDVLLAQVLKGRLFDETI